MVKQIHENSNIVEIRRILGNLNTTQKQHISNVGNLIKQAYPFNEIPSNIIDLYSDLVESSNEFNKTTKLFADSLLLS